MQTNLHRLQHYAAIIRSLPASALADYTALPEALLLERQGALAVYYAPFDYVNRAARVIVIGITPGIQQAVNATRALHEALRRGARLEEAARAAKHMGAFSGPLRANLVDLLDHIGLNRWLGLASCASLWGADARLAHTSSVLRYPVLLDGKNYGGSPAIGRTPLLEKWFRAGFAEEVRQLPEAVLVPLGPVAEAQVEVLIREGVVDERRVLSGLPHPSGANAERIAYFLQRKGRAQLSAKTSPAKIEQARERLQRKVAALHNADTGAAISGSQKSTPTSSPTTSQATGSG